MKHRFSKLLVGAALLCSSSFALAQGLEDIIVEEYHTVTQADADPYNLDFGGGSFPLVAGMKVYRVYVDMAPGYKLNTVFGSPETFPGSGISPNALDFSSTSSFWNDDNFGSEIPGQTRRFDEGTLFDSYITVNTTGIAGGTAGCGQATQQFGVLRTADTNGDLTTCGVYPGFTGNDGNIPATGPPATSAPTRSSWKRPSANSRCTHGSRSACSLSSARNCKSITLCRCRRSSSPAAK